MRKRKRYRIVGVMFLLLAVLVFFLICLDKRVGTVLQVYSNSQAETILLTAANQAVGEVFCESNELCSQITQVHRNEQGTITAVSINASPVNSLKAQLNDRIGEILAEKEYYELKVPIGSLIGSEWAVGRGPSVAYRMQLTTTACTDFESELTSEGINQVLHQIRVHVDLTGNVLIPWYHFTVHEENSFLVSQTMVVGEVPQAYTNLIGYSPSADEIAEDINNYGAELP